MAFALPVASSAATPQTLLDHALSALEGQPINETGTLGLTITDRTHTARTSFRSLTAHLRWNSRSLEISPHHIDSETSVSFDTIDFKRPPLGFAIPATTSSPLTIAWRSVSGSVYGQIAASPDALLATLKPLLGSSLVGKWLSVSASDVGDLPLFGEHLGDTIDLLRGKPFLRITRVESKRTKNGHTIIRVRAQMSGATIAAMQKDEIKKLQAARAWNKTAQTIIEKKYRDIRNLFASTAFAAEIDADDERLLRLEASGSASLPQQICGLNAKNKTICKPDGSMTLTYSGGASFLDEDARPILAPENAQPILDLLQEKQVADPSLH